MTSRRAIAIAAAIGAAQLAPHASAQDDPLPDQAITWKDLLGTGSTIKLYGFLRLDAQYDDSRFNDPSIPVFVLSEDDNPPGGVPNGVVAPEDASEFTLSGRLTRLGLDVKGPPVSGVGDPTASGKVEVDFYNIGLNDSDSRYALRLRLAYLDLDWGSWSLLAGQDWDVISPLYPAVNHDMMMWGVGNLGDRRPQLTAKNVTGVGESSSLVTEIGIALTGAISGSTVSGGLRSGEASGQPMLNARVGVEGKTGGGAAWQTGIWGHMAQEKFNATGAGEERFDSNSVGLDFRVPVYKDAFWLQGEYWMGTNVADVRGGILQGVNPNTGDEIDAEGGWLELGCKANDHLSLYAGYTMDDPDDDDLSSFMRSKNSAPYAAARWVYGTLRFGLEYLNWTTEYEDLDDGEANRIVGYVALYF